MKYAELVASNKGKKVDIKGVIFSVIGEIDKKGKLKNGDEVNYVALLAEGNSGETAELHPRKAQQLFSKGEAEGIKMLVDAVAEAAPAEKTEAATAPAAEVKTESAAAEAPAAAAPAEKTEATAGEAETAAEPKKLSKKEQCVAFFKFGVENGKTRQEILAAFATVGVTGPGAATYYQNCKAKKEGWV